MIKAELATKEALQSYYGTIPVTMKAWIVKSGSKVLGSFGIEYHDSFKVVFTEIRDDLVRSSRRDLVKMGRMLVDEMKLIRGPIVAVKDSRERTSDGFLRHFGFVPLNDEVYVWLRQQQ